MNDIKIANIEEINQKIRTADFQGKSKEEMKSLYIERNTFGILQNLDSMYRIFQADFFLNDVVNSQITLVNVNPSVFGDPLENPLLNQDFHMEDGEKVSLKTLMEKYFCLSWTEEDKDEDCRWEWFSYEHNGVRVKVSFSKFVNEFFNIKDTFYMLNYFVVKVTYHEDIQITNWISKSHYTDFLDSQGQQTALSLTNLSNDFKDEKEIRILYGYDPNNEFAKNEVNINGVMPHQRCILPFNWNNIVEEVLIDTRMNETEFEQYKKSLQQAGLTCPIKYSDVTL